MKIFKAFFMVMRKYAYNFTLYMGIFCGVLFGGVLPHVDENTAKEYVSPTVDYAILDLDESDLSKGLCEYLEKTHVKKEINSFEENLVRDDLYSRYIGAAIVLEKGFQEGFENGETAKYVRFYDIPDNMYSVVFSNCVSEYLKYIRQQPAGTSMAEATAKAIDTLGKKIEVTYPEDTSAVPRDKTYYFFLYMPWILTLMMIVSLTPVLARLNEERIRKRVYASPYKFTKMNSEIYLAMLIVGLGVCAVLFGIAEMTHTVNSNVGLYVVNMLVLMLVALSITFFVSKFVKNDMIISLIGNVVGLGMSFLCGVFVPQSVMSPTILKVAHILPAYWYVKANDAINAYKPGNLSSVFGPIGVELLFAVTLFGAGLYAAKVRRVKN